MPTQTLNKTGEEGRMKKLCRKGLDMTLQLPSCPKQTQLGGKKRFCLSCSLTLRYDTHWNCIVLQIRPGIVIIFYIGWIYLALYISGSLPSNRDTSFHQWCNWDQVTYLRYHKQPDIDSRRKWVSCLPDLSICMPRSLRQTGSTSWLAHGLTRGCKEADVEGTYWDVL